MSFMKTYTQVLNEVKDEEFYNDIKDEMTKRLKEL